MGQQDKLDIAQIGRRVKQYREAANCSQSRLAEEADISAVSLNRIENGRSTPSLLTIVQIAGALGVTPNDIVLDSIDAPVSLLDQDIAEQVSGMSKDERRKVIEYCAFLRYIRKHTR